MENILLAATAMGYSALWLDSPYFDAEKEKQARTVLGASDDYKLWAVVPIGKPDGTGSRREKLSFSERVSYGRLGNSK
jgi:nitroreductase